MSDSPAMPLPPVRSRRTAAVAPAERAPAAAPLPPYVPGRVVATAPPGDAVLLPEEEVSPAAAEPPPIDLVDEAPAAEPSFEAGESWIVGGEAEPAEATDEVVVTGMGEAWESGEGFPFETPSVEEAGSELAIEEVAEPEPDTGSAFPWEVPASGVVVGEAEAEAEAAVEPQEDATAEEPVHELSPWEELREAAAQSISVPEEGGVTASLGIEAATESAEVLAGEFAQRLEVLAERLRHEGLRAIDRTLAEGDRLDAAVAGFLTGYLAARDE